MKKISKLTVFILCIILSATCFSFVGCNKLTENPPDGYKDVTERPDIDEVPVNPFIKYPEFPTVKPIIDNTAIPEVYEYETHGYKKTEGDSGVTFSYENVDDWSYIYAKVQDVSETNANFKMIITANGAEKIFIQAIYYEMKENKYNAVTVYNADLNEGSQFAISELKEFYVIDEGYYTRKDLPLNKVTLLGFIILVDSNPKVTVSDKSGSITINSFDFLRDGDPALLDKFIMPSINGVMGDSGYNVAADNGIYTFQTLNPALYTRAQMNISNFSKNYAEFSFDATVKNVSHCVIGLGFGGGDPTWQNYIVFDTVLTPGTKNYTFNFDGISPISTITWDYVAGYFIKDYDVNSIIVYMDSLDGDIPQDNAELIIENVEFVKTVSNETKISKVWTSNTSSIKIVDNAEGGKGNIKYSYYTTWEYLLMNVSGYTMDANSFTVALQASDGISCIGIAFVADGTEYVLHSGYDKPNEANPALATGMLSGLGATVSLDNENKIYTYDFDFSKLTNVSGANQTKLNQKLITGIRFYFNDPTASTEFDGERDIRFIGAEFKN